MDATIRCLEKLGEAFDNFYMFVGNHDLYYKDKRDVSSTIFGRHIPGITFIDEISGDEFITDASEISGYKIELERGRRYQIKCEAFGYYEIKGNIEFLKANRSFHNFETTTVNELKKELIRNNIKCRF